MVLASLGRLLGVGAVGMPPPQPVFREVPNR